MRLSDLRDKKLKSLDGRTLGRVHEVHCDEGKVVALMCGSVSLIERWTAKTKAKRIPWDRVVKVGRDEIIVAPAKARRGVSPSASRSRQGTRRPSGRQSKR